MKTTTTATPAARMLATLWVESDQTALTDSRTELLSWAGRGGRYTVDDLEEILKGHGETLSAWVDDCYAHGFQSVYDAQALLTWLGY